MPLTVFNNSAYFAVPMPLSDFPQLLRDHMNDNPDTPQIEDFGEELTRDGFPAIDIPDFVTHVCEWGGKQGPRILSRILNQNTNVEIADALRMASSSLALGQLVDALKDAFGDSGCAVLVGLRYEGKKIGSKIYRENSDGVIDFEGGTGCPVMCLFPRSRLLAQRNFWLAHYSLKSVVTADGAFNLLQTILLTPPNVLSHHPEEYAKK